MDIGICRSVIDRLHGLDVLTLGSLALDRLRPLDQYAEDDLRYLIKEGEAELAAFRQRMEAGQGFRPIRWNAAAGGSEFASNALINEALYAQPTPLTPGLGYADHAGAPYPLFIQFYTAWRHGPLLLVDLTDWLPPRREPDVVRSLIVGRDMYAPPVWALLLWQASTITVEAASRYDRETIRPELAKLYELVLQIGGATGGWDDLLSTAERYDSEYLTRLERIRSRIEAYAAAHSVNHNRLLASTPRTQGTITAADLDYGVLHELRYALEALEAYYPGAVPSEVLTALHQGTGARPRKLWHGDEDGGHLALAHPEFRICDQIERYEDLTWAQLQSAGLVSVEIRRAPPRGYWNDLTPTEFGDIWAPL